MSDCFPLDAVFDILLRLPVKTILRFKCVSKQWCNLIEDSLFVDAHLRESAAGVPSKFIVAVNYSKYRIAELNPEGRFTDVVEPVYHRKRTSRKVIGSCNGLLCAYYESDQVILIMNVATKEHKMMPYPYQPHKLRDYSNRSPSYCVVGGFGYDRVNDDYKVVLIETRTDTSRSVSMVYSLKNNTWLWSLSVPHGTQFYTTETAFDGILVHGALHWGGLKRSTNMVNRRRLIISFNIETEEYGEVPLPDGLEKDFRVSKLGECLALICHLPQGDRDIFVEFWVMSEYMVKLSWTRIYYDLNPNPHPQIYFLHGIRGDRHFVSRHRKELVHKISTRKQVSDPNDRSVSRYGNELMRNEAYYYNSTSIEAFDLNDRLFKWKKFIYIESFSESLVRLGNQPSIRSKPTIRSKPGLARVLSQVLYF